MTTHTESDLVQIVEAVRRYNRFYTKKIGALNQGLLKSPFSLPEARVIYELAHREDATATALSEELAIDPGYLSRILRSLQGKGLIQRRPSNKDGRQSLLSLTESGEKEFSKLNAASRSEVAAMLEGLFVEERRKLLNAMETIEQILGMEPEGGNPYILRSLEPGDLGWVVQRHGALYAQEYGYDEQFEALVAEIVAKFVQNYNSRKERCWIVEREGENIGSVFLVYDDDSVARLRLLLVEPKARGLGVGKRLVKECVQFARKCGYQKIQLWTQDELMAARKIYENAGFKVVRKEPHHSFGKDLVGEVWEKKL